MLIPLLVVAIGVALGAGGIALVSQFSPAAPRHLAVRPAAQDVPRPLSEAAIRARIEPSVVDVTATLTYDDETASGTGFVIDARTGLILTNNHVIRGATAVRVTLPATGRTYRADIVGADVAADIAVLRIRTAAALTAAPVGDSAKVTAGAPVMSFGNTLRFVGAGIGRRSRGAVAAPDCWAGAGSVCCANTTEPARKEPAIKTHRDRLIMDVPYLAATN